MQSGPSNGSNGKGWQQYWAGQISDKKIYFIFALIILIVFLGGAWYGSHKGGKQGNRRILYYVDPMNPTHTSPEPGISPCGMKMEPVYADGEGGEIPPPSLPPGSVKITPQKQQLIGVRLGVVEKGPFRHNLRALGRVAVDETRIYSLTAFLSGWIKSIPANSTGKLVMKDEMLVSYRSPEILPIVQVYLEAMSRANYFRGPHRGSQIVSQIYKNEILLKNVGMSDEQIKELTQTRMATQDIQLKAPVTSFVLARNVFPGQKISPGNELYKLADLSRVWIVADLFDNEAPFVKPGTKVRVTLPQQRQTVWATVTDIWPNFDKVSQDLKVRLETDNPGYLLRPDMFVDLEFPVDLPEAVTLPVDAVMDTGLKKTVFLDRGNGYFEPRRVETGWRLGDRVEITKGIAPGERVIISGNFLVDSESRMKLASAGIFGEVARDPVTGVIVDASKAEAAGHQSRYKNQTYYFHSEESQRQFEQNPERYLEKQAKSQGVDGAVGQEKPAPLPAKCPVCGVEVNENEAKAKGLKSEYQGKTYYFCRYYCNHQFDKDPGAYIKEEPSGCCAHRDQESKEEPLIVKDPVCGLEVNRDQATGQRLKREYQGKNYYFCRDYCAREFDKAPERYASNLASSQAPTKLPQASQETPGTIIDPVCGMLIADLGQTSYKSTYQGKTYYFCSYSCKEVFDLDPERYLKERATTAAPSEPPEPPKDQPAPTTPVPAPGTPQQGASVTPVDKGEVAKIPQAEAKSPGPPASPQKQFAPDSPATVMFRSAPTKNAPPTKSGAGDKQHDQPHH